MLLVSRGGGGGVPTFTRPARVQERLHSSDPGWQRERLVVGLILLIGDIYNKLQQTMK